MSRLSRRDFLRRSGSSLLAVPVAGGLLARVVPALAAEAKLDPERVRFRPDIEPVVRWIEETPRSQVLDRAADELRLGLPYRDLLAGLFLAGIRNIKPRPVGFKFHTVMVINSAHQLSLDAPQGDRLYPLFWALDDFKRSQDRDVREGDWWLGPAREPRVVPTTAARKLLVEAMEAWDEEAADAAVTGLCRGAGEAELKEALWQYGARNYRNIGHNIIFTAQAFRTLETIGFQHAEPVLRSLVYGILDGQPDEASAAPFAANRRLAHKVRPDWVVGKPDATATTSFLDTLRHADPPKAASEAASHLDRGVAASSLWDAVRLAAGELLMRSPGIVSLHATTAANSLHYAFRASGQDTTRVLMLLQAASWIALFRDAASRRVARDVRIDQLEGIDGEEAPGVEEIFNEIGRDRLTAARQALAFAAGGGTPDAFMDLGRRLIFNKGTDAHDYKFSAAVFEELQHTSPQWRPRLMAASTFYLKPSSGPDSRLLERTHSALSRISA